MLGILALQARGYRKLEAVIAGFIGVIVAAFAAQVVLAEPSAGDAAGGLVPGFEGSESVLLAVVTALIVGLNLFLLEQTLV